MQNGNVDKTREDAFNSIGNSSSSLHCSSGPSLEEKLFSSCDLTVDKKAQVNFKSRQAMSELAPRAPVSVHFQSSSRAHNWAQCSDDLSAAFTVEKTPEPPTASPAPTAAEAQPHQASSASGESRALRVFHLSFKLGGAQLAAVLCLSCSINHKVLLHIILEDAFSNGALLFLFIYNHQCMHRF